MSQKLPLSDFNWVEEKLQFNKDSWNYNNDSDEGNFLQVDVQCPKQKLMLFTWKNWKLKNSERLYQMYLKRYRIRYTHNEFKTVIQESHELV